MTRPIRTPSMIEQVRTNTMLALAPGDLLDFIPAALALGLNQKSAEEIDELLTIRIMRAKRVAS